MVLALYGILVLSVTIFSAKSSDSIRVLEYKPQPSYYSEHIREFHECVSCNDDDRARRSYNLCVRALSQEHKKIMNDCCKDTYGVSFCKKAAVGKTDYKTVCSNPRKGLEVERCFWKKNDKNSDDIGEYRQCKRKILENYCTSRSSSH